MDDPLLRQFLADNNAACPGCGYNLRGVTSQICPECGTELRIDLAGRRPAPLLTRLTWVAITLTCLHTATVIWSTWFFLWMGWMSLVGNGGTDWSLFLPRFALILFLFVPGATCVAWLLACWRQWLRPQWREPAHFAVLLAVDWAVCVLVWAIGTQALR